MIFVPVIVVILWVIIFTPTSTRGRRSGYRRKYKGLIGLADDMERARKRRSKHQGVMCGPGGSKKKR